MEPERRAIYLDHHATTPADPRVVEAMIPWFGERGGNASSPHLFGWESAEAVHVAREQVAAMLGVRGKDLLFTAGATESNNIALRGFFAECGPGSHLVTSNIEHPSVAEVTRLLETEGTEVTRVPVGSDGIVAVDDVAAALRENTKLCSVMWVNNEIGTVQPVAEIAQLCDRRGVCFHSDAAQAIGRVQLDLNSTKISLLSLSAHKFYGPVGIGALVRRRQPRSPQLAPIMVGGGQEAGLRPGTLPVALIVGLGRAAQLVREERDTDEVRIRGLRCAFLEEIASLDGVRQHGDAERRVPGNLSLAFDGVEAESLLLELKNVGLSVGSACHSSSHLPSPVLTAIGVDAETAQCTLRVGIGRPNTEAEVREVASRVARAVTNFRDRMPRSTH
jgi:cysteine desulfurase